MEKYKTNKMWLLFVVSFIFLNLANNIFAHTERDNKEEWSPISAGPVTTWTAPLCEKGKFVAQSFFFYNHSRGTFNSEGHYDSLPKGDEKYQYQEQIFMQYGLTDRLEIDAQTVYQQNYRKQGNQKAHARGLGDSYLFMRYCAFEETAKFPHLTGLFQLKLPTGKYQKLDADKLGTDSMGATSGGGSYDLGFGINLTKKLKPFIFHFDSIYSFPQEVKVDGVNTRYGNYLNYDFGVEYFLTKSFNLMFEFNGLLQGDKEQSGDEVPGSDISYLTGAFGFGWSNTKLQTLIAYQRTLTGTNSDANDSVVLTLVYTF